jgi:hypothetical protein
MVYEPMLWKSYSQQDKVDFLVEFGCRVPEAEEYSFREFESLPAEIRTAIEDLENFC